jgi:hypothetical protein
MDSPALRVRANVYGEFRNSEGQKKKRSLNVRLALELSNKGQKNSNDSSINIGFSGFDTKEARDN